LAETINSWEDEVTSPSAKSVQHTHAMHKLTRISVRTTCGLPKCRHFLSEL